MVLTLSAQIASKQDLEQDESGLWAPPKTSHHNQKLIIRKQKKDMNHDGDVEGGGVHTYTSVFPTGRPALINYTSSLPLWQQKVHRFVDGPTTQG